MPGTKLNVSATTHNLTCPACGFDRFQRHERGVFEYEAQGEADGPSVKFKIDEVAVQCLKCLAVHLQAELLK